MTDLSAAAELPFVERHIGPDADSVATMLREVGFDDLDALMAAAVPPAIHSTRPLELPEPVDEESAVRELRRLAALNNPLEPMIGLGYHGTITPPVIRRNVLESPAWYTAYTPYQPEISQGRLEALLNFQTMVGDLTGLPTAGASLLDEGTAAAEAMTLVRRAQRGSAGAFVVDENALPQTIAVIRTRAEAMRIEVVVADLADGLPEVTGGISGVLVQYPGADGEILDPRPVIDAAHEAGALAVVAADLLALTLLESPGALGADVAVGSSQRFGVPLFYGGPHAAYLSVRNGLERHLPGRLVGVSVDAEDRPAYRLALQTREQHIRRDKATSNICTAQVLLAVVAAMYAVYHGPAGLTGIARTVHGRAARLAAALRAAGHEVLTRSFFDTITVSVPGRAGDVVDRAHELGLHLRFLDGDRVGVSVSESTREDHLLAVLQAFGADQVLAHDERSLLPEALRRRTDFLTHPVFNSHRSETSMLRYLARLARRDYALDRGMIPLGSCTMKLNATAEMEPIGLDGFAGLHPFAPAADAEGYHRMITELEGWLAELTGYAAVSVQPNAGSQGELAGLLAIRAYHHSRGDAQREVCLIPSSAHGTNAASAVMAGMRVVVVKADDDGSVDLEDLRARCDQHRETLAAIMVTYPSTHGAYEDGIAELCRVVHDHGGQVYVDGANLNALVGHALPGEFGGDVSHLNLHKTFCIPHGGGGPGVGPVGVREHLVDFLPSHPAHPLPERREGIGPVSAAPYGSAGILPISWAYVRMMGAPGLTRATAVAVLAANYVARRLEEDYPVLYRGHGGLVAHECILDLRGLARSSGVTVDDVAKRLIDYGFHAPTMSFPVAGTLMVEPTESEDLAELDRFVSAMVAIRAEIRRVEQGEWDAADSPLRHAPHTAAVVGTDAWKRDYPRELGAFPGGPDQDKYWPPVARIDQAYGDRNLVCSCPDPQAFEDGLSRMPVTDLTARRLQAAVAQEQVRARRPVPGGGAHPRRRAGVARLPRHRHRCRPGAVRPPVPHRVDHQDHDGGARGPAARPGSARPRRPPRAIPAWRRLRRPDPAQPALPLRRAARRASGPVVGACRRRWLRRAARPPRRRRRGVRGGGDLPLQQPGLRTARGGGLGRHRHHLVGAPGRGPAAAARDAAYQLRPLRAARPGMVDRPLHLAAAGRAPHRHPGPWRRRASCGAPSWTSPRSPTSCSTGTATSSALSPSPTCAPPAPGPRTTGCRSATASASGCSRAAREPWSGTPGACPASKRRCSWTASTAPEQSCWPTAPPAWVRSTSPGA